MRLKSLTLAKIVDVAYWCGYNRTPVSLLLAAPPGSGKTWATQSLRGYNRVCYINTGTSPNEHRKLIITEAARTSLLINDDIGYFLNRREEYFVTFGMIIDGRIAHTVFKTGQFAEMKTSLVLCCTDTQYYDVKDSMVASGLHSRLVPLVMGLSAQTRRAYQQSVLSRPICDTTAPPERRPAPMKCGKPKDEIIAEFDVDPRLISNIRRMSQYMSEAETEELIDIAHRQRKEWEV